MNTNGMIVRAHNATMILGPLVSAMVASFVGSELWTRVRVLECLHWFNFKGIGSVVKSPSKAVQYCPSAFLHLATFLAFRLLADTRLAQDRCIDRTDC